MKRSSSINSGPSSITVKKGITSPVDKLLHMYQDESPSPVKRFARPPYSVTLSKRRRMGASSPYAATPLVGKTRAVYRTTGSRKRRPASGPSKAIPAIGLTDTLFTRPSATTINTTISKSPKKLTSFKLGTSDEESAELETKTKRLASQQTAVTPSDRHPAPHPSLPAKPVRRPRLPRTSIELTQSRTKVAGVQNLGNSCYLGAVLICLLSLRRFTKAMQQSALVRLMEIRDPKRVQGRIFWAMLDLIVDREENTNMVSDPSVLKSAVSAETGFAVGDEQEDAHEFLLVTLDALSKEIDDLCGEIFQTTSKHISLTEVSSNTSVDYNIPGKNRKENRLAQSDGHRVKVVHPVHDVFETTLEINDECLNCKHLNVNTESRPIFSFNPPQNYKEHRRKHLAVTINSCLRSSFQPEEIEKRCDHCGHAKARRWERISRMPKVLILHLKRFMHSKQWSTVTKIHDKISVSYQLNIRSLITQSNKRHKAESKENATGPIQRVSGDKYKLKAVVRHMGETVSVGHYVADILDGHHWQTYNDSIVNESRVQHNRGLAPSEHDRATEGYLFVYVRGERE
eukprot:Clim_evm13s108 gene=Clim_evmTU13s108